MGIASPAVRQFGQGGHARTRLAVRALVLLRSSTVVAWAHAGAANR